MKRCLLLLPLLVVASTYGCDSSSVSPTDDGGTTPDGGEVPVPSTCETPTAPAVVHDDAIEADETWGAGLHDVAFNFTIQKGATLTLAPCAVVRVKPAFTITVGNSGANNGGKLVAKGRPDKPIVIEALESGKWGSILVTEFGFADLEYVTLRNAGADTSRAGAALHLFGSASAPLQPLAHAAHVTIENAGRYGVVMETHGGFDATSADLTIRGSGDTAMRLALPSVSSVPTGKYTGNTIDGIRLTGSAAYNVQTDDQTIHDRGVPYIVGEEREFGTLRIGGSDPGLVTLTIEAGVTLKFPKATTSYVQVSSGTGASPANAALKVLGTAAKPVTFTSAEARPEKGDWVGILFGNVPDASNTIEHARIEYAGGDTTSRGFSCGTPGLDGAEEISNEAAIILYGQPKRAFVTDTVIAHSAKNGIERGWTLGQSFDFLPTNTFEDITHCKQTAPKPGTGSCPSPPICDK